MDSDDIRDRLRKQRERWLRERDIDKEKKGTLMCNHRFRGRKRNHLISRSLSVTSESIGLIKIFQWLQLNDAIGIST
jgi:hypothetical protein